MKISSCHSSLHTDKRHTHTHAALQNNNKRGTQTQQHTITNSHSRSPLLTGLRNSSSSSFSSGGPVKDKSIDDALHPRHAALITDLRHNGAHNGTHSIRKGDRSHPSLISLIPPLTLHSFSSTRTLCSPVAIRCRKLVCELYLSLFCSSVLLHLRAV